MWDSYMDERRLTIPHITEINHKKRAVVLDQFFARVVLHELVPIATISSQVFFPDLTRQFVQINTHSMITESLSTVLQF